MTSVRNHVTTVSNSNHENNLGKLLKQICLYHFRNKLINDLKRFRIIVNMCVYKNINAICWPTFKVTIKVCLNFELTNLLK